MRTAPSLQPLLLGIKHYSSNRVAVWPLVFGLFVGLFLAHVVDFEHETDVDSAIRAQIGGTYLHRKPENPLSVFLKCVVLVQHATVTPHKFVAAVRDTYSRRCNETFFFTSDKKLEERFAGELDIYHIDGTLDSRRYPIFHEVLAYVLAGKKRHENEWIVMLDEQNYLVTQNMRHFLSRFSPSDPIIAARVTDVRSLWHYVFPFSSTVFFDIHASIAISSAAAQQIVENRHCSPRGWGMPLFTGKALLQCAQYGNLEIWDPVDEENKRLLLGKSPRNLFAQNKYTLTGRYFEEMRKLSECCSDNAIVFGLVNYRDQRVLEYALQKMRVFAV